MNMPAALITVENVIDKSLRLITPAGLTGLLAGLTPHCCNDDACRKAAVYIVLDDKARMLVIQKPCYNDGYPWSGQIAFPGGLVEKTDRGFLDAALREVFEEVGITRERLSTIGSLGRFPTIGNVSIEAFLGFIAPPVELCVQTSEVARAMWVETAGLLETHLLNGYTRNQVSIEDLAYPADNATIWGATARIIQFFLNALVAT